MKVEKSIFFLNPTKNTSNVSEESLGNKLEALPGTIKN